MKAPGRLSPWLVGLGFVCLVALCTITNIDRSLAVRFYTPAAPQAWALGALPPWSWLYTYGEYPAILMAIAAFLVGLGSVRRPAWRAYQRHCLILVLAVALGPGVLVNAGLKPLWGRPRPRHIVLFGGTQPYRPWWRPGGPGVGKSFPSGHAAMGYILVAGALLVPASRRHWRRRLALAGALGYGSLMGLARMLQGGHFASDVVWAAGLMCVTAFGLRMLLGGAPRRAAPAAVSGSTTPVPSTRPRAD
ncbi:hypothetical protein NKDENANG_00870 [Candidatus Entotheonellaceae bacterium PAL068K]